MPACFSHVLEVSLFRKTLFPVCPCRSESKEHELPSCSQGSGVGLHQAGDTVRSTGFAKQMVCERRRWNLRPCLPSMG